MQEYHEEKKEEKIKNQCAILSVKAIHLWLKLFHTDIQLKTLSRRLEVFNRKII